ncbi:pentatricopeptide repeat-containing protein At1g73400, mitochondrial [Phragmites australis]|uniref:pentatricopeptide repeat-containing protein At1g73400, mitochondrial n=1 Tax=Phragmites australis TaxID=29695 RepID=UPI002D794E5B|nr:pentatricopeptide repeat-containing protein At1g73400, mitochondrial [Phragmites australis]XP_062221940.1 pentatricopeptide repeat-containing protein At1g73400, mitochondrial [Phragmites australis]XP_062221941.1 pentatricopeptide repeat-containing protein At1g73400, mitochondrial [Phragmites australis]XP_062221942.1 pentatricopeptide repeat-containing protein At1g73400, mitochondrial [Phragmites australis]
MSRRQLPLRLRHLCRFLAAASLSPLASARYPVPSGPLSIIPAMPPPRWHLSSLPARRLFSDHAILPTHLQDECFAALSDRIYDAVIKTEAESSEGTGAALDALVPELTTPLVTDVLHRLRYEEKLAFRFFAWASHQDGYDHEPATYNDVIDILSSTRYKARQFGVLCDVLDHMKRHGTRSVPVEDLLAILRAYTERHLTHLRKLAKKRRVRMRTPPETDALNVLLDAFCKCGMVREAEAVFSRVKRKLLGNAETYNILFFGWCRARDPKKAMKVLEEMIQMKHAPESFTYNAAIDSFCSAGLVSEARELFEFMRTEGSTISSPTAKTHSIMIVALAKADQMEECFALISDMRNCGCMPDVSTYKDLIEGMCLVGKLDAAYRVLEEMGKAGFPPDIVTYNCFVQVLCSLRKADDALELCERMIEAHCEPSVHTYNMLMVMFFEMGDAHRALDIWLEMDKRGCKRAVDTYEIAIDGLFDSGRTEDATALLNEVINRDMKLSYKKFDAIMLRLSAVGNLGVIHRLSEHMRRFYNVAMSRRFAITQKKKSIGLRRK